MSSPDTTDLDVVIIGAGLSGINAAYRLQTMLPDLNFTILERRFQVGGTWAFWKYPGVRSDSSMGVFGFPWHPWPHEARLAEAHQIQAYLADAAASQGIDRRVQFGYRVVGASWSSVTNRWTLQVDVFDEKGNALGRKTFTAWWLMSCSGYYDYDKPLPAVIPGLENFRGKVVHPQFWHDGIDHADKRIVIIGSGATTVTLLPALAKTAKSVTMLQRSPSYVLPLPARDRVGPLLRRWLPARWAMVLNWWHNMLLETFFMQILLRFPKFGRKLVRKGMQRELPKGFDIDTHFDPRYNVGDQRLCFCPDSDFFKALHQPKCQVVTDTIETVTEKGILLKSGRHLEADMIVTATGLYMMLLSGIPIYVDGEKVQGTIGQRYTWQGVMLERIPNAGTVLGYTYGTWTPGADARTRTLFKVIKHMRKTGALSARPYIPDDERKKLPKIPAVSNSSTYIVTAKDRLPLTAGVGPWRNGKTWAADAWHMMFGSVTKGLMYTYPGQVHENGTWNEKSQLNVHLNGNANAHMNGHTIENSLAGKV